MSQHTSSEQLFATFGNSFKALHLARPLPSFESSLSIEAADGLIDLDDQWLCAINDGGVTKGIACVSKDSTGPLDSFLQVLSDQVIIEMESSLSEALLQLQNRDFLLCRHSGQLSGVILREDLQKPALRMWLFGVLTQLEDNLNQHIPRIFPDDSWQTKLSESRLLRAKELQAERVRRQQNSDLIHCLQISDKLEIFTRDAQVRERFGIGSGKNAHKLTKALEKLRNNLAHHQPLSESDLDLAISLAKDLPQILQASRLAQLVEDQ